jgi:uncharacterized protein
MKIIIAGGTGNVGIELTKNLIAKGHDVWILTRGSKKRNIQTQAHLIRWDAMTSKNWGHHVEDTDAIVNLAGETIEAWHWTAKKKKSIVESRIQTGSAIVEAVRNSVHKPKVLLQASGADYYPSDLNGEFSVSSPPGTGFMGYAAVLWEQSTQQVEDMGVRRIVMRCAQVMSPRGGSLAKLILPFKFFVGGSLGSGEQWWTWIHIKDVAAAMVFLIENKNVSGTLNLCAPQPIKMKQFGKILAKVLNRPYWFPVPEFALKLILGEMSALVLGSRRIYPDLLQNSGFKFEYPELQQALNSLLK